MRQILHWMFAALIVAQLCLMFSAAGCAKFRKSEPNIPAIDAGDTPDSAKAKAEIIVIGAETGAVVETAAQSVFPRRSANIWALLAAGGGVFAGVLFRYPGLAFAGLLAGLTLSGFAGLQARCPWVGEAGIILLAGMIIYDAWQRRRAENAVRETVAGVQKAKKAIIEAAATSTDQLYIDGLMDAVDDIRGATSEAHSVTSKKMVAAIKGDA